MPSLPPLPRRFAREDERRGRRDSFDGGKGKGKGWGKGAPGRGGGRGGGGGRLPPPPDAAVIDRPIVQYRDLDAPEEDDLFS